jgi:hypothetical protein
MHERADLLGTAEHNLDPRRSRISVLGLSYRAAASRGFLL